MVIKDLQGSAVAGLKLLGGPTTSAKVTKFELQYIFFGVCQIIGGARAPPAPPHATALQGHV